MAKKVLNEEVQVETYLKLMIETSALKLLHNRWSSAPEPECSEWQVKMEILTHLLDKKDAKKESVLSQVSKAFPELKDIDWNISEH